MWCLLIQGTCTSWEITSLKPLSEGTREKWTHLPMHLLAVTKPVFLTSKPETAAGVILPILKECKVWWNASLVHKSISFRVSTFWLEVGLSSSFAPASTPSFPCSPSHCQTNVCAGFQGCSFQSLSLNQKSLLAWDHWRNGRILSPVLNSPFCMSPPPQMCPFSRGYGGFLRRAQSRSQEDKKKKKWFVSDWSLPCPSTSQNSTHKGEVQRSFPP